MSETTPYIDTLLDKVEALFDCGAARQFQMAKAIGKNQQQVYSWVRERRFKPDGETTLRIHQWVEQATLSVAAAGGKMSTAYRDAFNAVQEERSRQRERKDQ